MRRIAALLVLAVAVSAAPKFKLDQVLSKHTIASERSLVDKFTQFVEKFNKVYASEEEVLARFNNFVRSLEKIEELEDEAKGLTTYGINQFSDLTWQEFKTTMLQSESPEDIALLTAKAAARANYTQPAQYNHPDNWDWRRSGIVGPIKNQGGCGSCWSFATAAVVESLAAKSNRGLHSYAEQQMIDCIEGGCAGGVLQHSFGYAQDHGLPTENDYPYKATKGQCHNANVAIKLSKMVEIPGNEEAMANSVTDGGPIAIPFKVGNAFQHYSGGIISNTDCENNGGWHAIALVGYGNDNGNLYWIGKNSWGTGWGEGGFFRARRGSNWCEVTIGPVGGWV